MDDAGIETFQETVPFEHEGAQPPAEDKGLMDSIQSVLAAAGVIGINPYTIFKIMKMNGIGIMDAIEFVKNKTGKWPLKRPDEEEVIENGPPEWAQDFLDKLNKGEAEWPTGPSIPLPGSKRKPHPDDKYYPKTPNEGMQPFNAATGGRVKYASGGINNTRTGLQWGSDKGEGLGGEEVEADMRYEGGFMPYGEEPKADDVPARLSKDEFVFTDQAVAGAGDGDIDLGAERLYNVMKSLEGGGRISEETQGEMGQGIGELI